MRLNTVNVIEMRDDVVVGMQSFQDDAEGVKEAEDVFIVVVAEAGAILRNIRSHLDDGFYESGDYKVILAHSTK